MVATLVVCSAFLSTLPEPTRGDLEAYRSAAARAGGDAAANVGLALWCEARGLDAERLRHLTRALSADPSNPTARGLLGMVADRGGWRRPDNLADAARSDAALTAALAAYNARREAMPRPETADAHWALATWCEASGLRPEAVAHYTAVARLAPDRADAWKALGCVKSHGRWTSAADVAAEKADALARVEAERRWGPRVRQWWKDWLAARDDARRAETLDAFAAGLEPAAVPTIRALLAAGTPEQQEAEVRLLDRIDAPEASGELARLIAVGRTPGVRLGAIDAVTRRDPNEVIEPLIGLLHDPLKVETSRPRGAAAELKLEDEDAILRKIYIQKTVRADVNTNRGVPGWAMLPLTPARRRAPTALQKLNRDLNAAAGVNARRAATNGFASVALTRITGESFGDDPEAWRSWWAAEQGVPTTKPYERKKPTITKVSRTTTTVLQTVGHSYCFGKGTPVRTLFGPRPIESIKVGDRVLTADPTTGALSVQPVVAVYQNPPSPTLKLDLGGAAVVTTPIHRFWKPGRGWVMARDLKPGDAVRAVDGLARVEGTESNEVQPVYNLEVAVGRSFFVGDRGVLVHDYSPSRPVTRPFDAVAPLAEVARATAR